MSTRNLRQPSPAVTIDPELDQIGKAAGDSHALTIFASRSADVAKRYDDGQPYERGRLVREVQFFWDHSTDAMVELGERLLVIKENESHGDFLEIVTQRLMMNPRTAQRIMAATLKMRALPASSAKALTALGRTKLFDLLDESGDDIVELCNGGTIVGLALDDVRRMSARELSAALNDERNRSKAKDKVIAAKDQKINEQAEANALRDANPAQTQLDALRACTFAVEPPLHLLVRTIDEVTKAPASDAADLSARQTLEYVLQLVVDAAVSRGLAVEVMGERVEPGWLRPIKEDIASVAVESPKPRRKGGHLS